MSAKVQQLFTEIAPTYDFINHALSLNIDKIWRKKTIQSITCNPRQPIHALDLCAGTLDLSLDFLKKFPFSHVTALDFSQQMLDLGREKLAKYADRTTIKCGDALNLPFSPATFDVVFCGYGFRNLDDKEKGFAEISRVLKPGGQMLILDFFKPDGLLSRLFYATYGKHILPWAGRLLSGHGTAYRYLNDSIAGFYTLNECMSAATKHGFVKTTGRNFFLGVSSLVRAQKL